jgi:tetratricopeptide (TPR) repeat protein
VRSGIAKFKQMRHFATMTCLAGLLLGCASAPMNKQDGSSASLHSSGNKSTASPQQGPEVAALVKQGEAALGKGDLKSAQADYARASMLSEDAGIAERATVFALARHDSAAAQKALQRWQSLGGNPMALTRARAQLALDEGRTDDARKLLMQLTEGGEKPAWQAFGKVVLGARDAAQAGRVLEQVATPQRLPDDVTAWLAMSEIGQKLGRYAYAQHIAEAAARRFHSSDAYAWAASLYAQRGDAKAARDLYAEAVKASPDDVDLRLAYAGLLAKEKRFSEAEHVLASGPQDKRSYAARAAFAARSRDMPALRRTYDDLRKAPEDVRSKSYYLLGQLASLVDKPQAAVEWLSKVPIGADHGLDAGIRRAAMLQQLGKSDQAHALVATMRKHFAGQDRTVRKLDRVDAELYMGNSEFAQAAAAYTRALKIDSDNTELLYGRGLAYAEAGNTDAAIADLRKVLKLAPDNINAVNALGYTLADAGRNLGEATRLIERAHKAQPDDPAITDSWGWLQYRLGHLVKAEKALRASWDKRKDPEVGAHLAQVLLARGKKAEAVRIYRAALHLDPQNRHVLALKEKLQP